jgi:uncharacterized Zn ribbon protein
VRTARGWQPKNEQQRFQLNEYFTALIIKFTTKNLTVKNGGEHAKRGISMRAILLVDQKFEIAFL